MLVTGMKWNGMELHWKKNCECLYVWSVLQKDEVKNELKNNKGMLCNLISRKGISVRLNVELLGEVNCLVYFQLGLATTGLIKNEITHRLEKD